MWLAADSQAKEGVGRVRFLLITKEKDSQCRLYSGDVGQEVGLAKAISGTREKSPLSDQNDTHDRYSCPVLRTNS
jgi:hypothetical protein